MTLNPSNNYCTIGDVEDILSVAGVQLRSDDTPPTEWGNALNKAGNQIDKLLFQRYDPTQLILSPLVLDWCATIAAYYLCTRRGNPAPQGIAQMYHEAIEDMTKISKGWAEIPGIGVRRTYAPGTVPLVAAQRPFPQVVVERSRASVLGTGGSPINAGNSVTSAWDWMGWNCHAFLQWNF